MHPASCRDFALVSWEGQGRGDGVVRKGRGYVPIMPKSTDRSVRRVRECHDALFEEALTRRVIGAFYEVYNALG